MKKPTLSNKAKEEGTLIDVFAKADAMQPHTPSPRPRGKYRTQIEAVHVNSDDARRAGYDAAVDVLVWDDFDTAGADSAIVYRFRLMGVIDRTRPADSYARRCTSVSWRDYTAVDHIPQAKKAAAQRAATKALRALAAHRDILDDVATSCVNGGDCTGACNAGWREGFMGDNLRAARALADANLLDCTNGGSPGSLAFHVTAVGRAALAWRLATVTPSARRA
jgi:hypothetical protein